MKTTEDGDCHSGNDLTRKTNPFELVQTKLIGFNPTNLKSSVSTQNHVLVLDGIIPSRTTYLSLSKKQIKSALKKYKIQKVVEKIYVNQFGIPAIIHRIIGGNVFDFAKLVGLSPLSPEQTKDFEHILNCCAFTFVDENVIYNAEK